MTVGHGPTTAEKHYRLNVILPMLIKMSKNHIRQYEGQFYYIEANAGSGEYEGTEGSPILALRELIQSGIPYIATLVEQNRRHAAELAAALDARGLFDPRYTEIVNADNADVLPDICRNIPGEAYANRGLILFDPNGAANPLLINAVMALPSMKRIDLLVNVNAAQIKRNRGAAQVGTRGFDKPEHVIRLRDYPPLLHKTELFIEEPRGKYQWSLWYGTNWRGFPVRMPKYNMHPVASHEGQAALRVMDQTHEELDGGRGA